MNTNICKFISTQKSDGINIVNFVYEREADFKQSFAVLSTYTLALVTSGSGILHTRSGDYQIGESDVFVTFPAKAYYIENMGGLEFIYISFTGTRAQALMERLEISYSAPVFHRFDFMIELWKNTFNISNNNNADLFCEALILYTFGFVCSEGEESDYSERKNDLILAKQYIDLHFSDSSLDLKSVSQKFSYSPKYFSSAFKKMVRVNFSEYLKIKRLSHALSLIENGVTNVNDLAELCGYKEPMYFSKSFKQYYGVSPKKWKKQMPK